MKTIQFDMKIAKIEVENKKGGIYGFHKINKNYGS